jgi:hypothetical protein
MAPYIDTTWIGGVEIGTPPLELHLRTEPFEPIPPARPGTGDDFVRSYGNDQLNSRVNMSLAPGRWEIAWKAQLPVRAPSCRLLRLGERILVDAPVEWCLYDNAGKQLSTGSVAPGGITLDAARGVYYMMNRLGYLAARELSNGASSFLMGIDFGNSFMHPFVAPRRHFLLASGIELQRNPHGAPRQSSNLQLIDLGEQPEVSNDHILKSFRTVKTLKRKTACLFAAMNENALVVATDDRIYVADTGLNILKVLTGKFTPLAMSLDEKTNIYLVALSDNSMVILLCATPDGELSCARELRGSFGETVSPPLVGFDHTVHLLFRERIKAYTADGLLLWDEHAGAAIAGAVVMADGNLLVAAGGLLEAFDQHGKRTILRTFPGEAVCSQPLPGSDGSLFIATEEYLYELIAR